MHNAYPGLNIVDIVSGESSPGSCTKCKAYARPVIDAYRAIAQVGSSPLHRCRYCRIFEGGGMDNKCCTESPPQMPVSKRNGTINVIGNRACIKSRLSEETTKGFCRKANIVRFMRINAANQCPGKLLLNWRAKLLSIWMGSNKRLLTLTCAWIIGLAY